METTNGGSLNFEDGKEVHFQQPRQQSSIVLHSIAQQQVLTPAVGPTSIKTTCPHCRCVVTTDVSYRSTAKTHIACLLLTLTTCCCCCWVPYCMNTCRNANHFCPMCRAYIGTYQS